MERYRVWVRLPTSDAEEWLDFESETTPLLGQVVQADTYMVRLTGHRSGAPGLYVGKIAGAAESQSA